LTFPDFNYKGKVRKSQYFLNKKYNSPFIGSYNSTCITKIKQIAGTEKTEIPPILYQLIGIYSPVNLLVKLIIAKRESPINALKTTILKNLWLLI
jgi:hypothetical protein